jgi:hypothetical protein
VAEEFQIAAVAGLRERLDAVGYRLDEVSALFGNDALVALRDHHDPAPALWATRNGSPLATAARLFQLGVPEPVSVAEAALGPMGPWVDAGLLDISDGLARATVALRGYAPDRSTEWLIASDLLDGRLRADAVMGVGGASQTLAHMTVRRPVKAALDLGTGGGIQALYAARHAEVVRATDPNPRALRLAALNLALNGVDGVELRAGGLFGPAEGRTYGLIVSNPPFVISPDRSLLFRDGDLEADVLCRRIVAEAPSYLEPGGYCQLLANWTVGPGETWGERVSSWFADSPCDVWVLQRNLQDPSEYARIWLRQDGGEPAPGSYDNWMRWYDHNGVAAIGSGVISMRLPQGDSATHRLFQDIRHEIDVPAGGAVEGQFARLDVAAQLDDEALLRRVFRVPEGLQLEQTSTLSGAEWAPTSLRVRQLRGMRWIGDIQPPVAALLAGCDGTRPLADALAGVGVGAAEVSAALATVRQLVVEGFLLSD